MVVGMVREKVKGDLRGIEAVDRIAKSGSVESMRMTDRLDATNIANAEELLVVWAVAVAVCLLETRGAEGGAERMAAKIAIGGRSLIDERWRSGRTRG